jgi:hypothetical protein
MKGPKGPAARYQARHAEGAERRPMAAIESTSAPAKPIETGSSTACYRHVHSCHRSLPPS